MMGAGGNRVTGSCLTRSEQLIKPTLIQSFNYEKQRLSPRRNVLNWTTQCLLGVGGGQNYPERIRVKTATCNYSLGVSKRLRKLNNQNS